MINSALVHEYLVLSAERFPDKDALVCGEERWTYRSIDKYSDQLANTLFGMGMNSQERVIVFLDNSAESVISMYGILKSGGIFVILNSTVKAKKLSYIIRDSGAKILITHLDKKEVVGSALNSFTEKPQIIWVGDSSDIPEPMSSYSLMWNSITASSHEAASLSKNEEEFDNQRHCSDKELAALIYTSGSTGEPKGVMSSHFNMISASKSIIQYLDNSSNDVVLNVLPLSFDYGLYQVIMTIMFGGTVVLEKSFLFPVKILECLERNRVTGFPIVPTIAALLLKMKKMDRYDFSSLRYITNTGAALPVEHIRKLRILLPHVRIYSMYGLTECKRVSYLPPEEIDRRPSSVGKAMPNCEVSILSDEGKEVMPDMVGKLVVRGANVMQGYWNSPDLNEKTFQEGCNKRERILYTEDLFRKDEEGYLYFVGRNDDLIKTKGERVAPKEIENTISEIEGVLESAVIGVPDSILGQAVKAFVVVDSGFALTKKEILRYCAENLEIFMVPKYIEFLEDLPRTPNGKIDKEILRNSEAGYVK